MPPLSLSTYALIAAILLAAALGLGLKVQTAQLHSLQAEYADFKAGVKALGEQAERGKVARETVDQERKAKADVQNSRSLAALRADNERLRNSRPSGSIVPSAAPGARSPETACFDRTLLDGAIRAFDSGASSLVGKGDEARVNLDGAKVWAQP